jgi:hypothetical protein
VTFTTGQTFPGAGTITGVTAGTDLTGGGTSGAVTLNVDLTKVPQLLGTNSFTGNQSVTGNVGVTGSISGGAGSFTGLVTEAAGALLPASAPATTTQGYNSQPMDLVASAYNTSAPPSGAPQNQDFQWLAEPVGNNTGSPSGKLDLLFGANGATPTETGLNIASNGQITFAPGQTFPGGGGTVTSVGTGAGLTGGPITSSGTIYVPSGGIINTMLVNSSMTISGVPGSGLTGGGAVALGGSLTSLSVDGSLVPLLNVNDTFSGSITANAFASGSGVQGALAEWTGTTPPYTVGNSPITDSGGTLTSAEPISAPSITTTGSGNAPQVQLGSGTMLVTWTLGTGAPSNSCFVGSLYSRIDGGAGSTLYVCEGPAQPGQGTWTPK